MTVSRQKKTGERIRTETRRALLEAASAQFTESGYVATTVAQIAKRAGVTVQTLYLSWGSKRELLRACAKDALAGDEDPTAFFEKLLEIGSPDSAEAVIEKIAEIFVETADRASVIWKLYREAAVVDQEIAADWHQLQTARRNTMAVLTAHIPAPRLRAGLDRKMATDTAWTLASPETYNLLIEHADYSRGQYLNWLDRSLRSALLK